MKHRFYIRLFKVLLFILVFTSHILQAQTTMKEYARVRAAYANQKENLLTLVKPFGFQTFPAKIILVGYKNEMQLEVWAAAQSEPYQLIKTYPFCTNSGILGPKRIEGDCQIPEGFYHISHFNPVSSFHLSLKVSYPNASDRILSNKLRPGGDIFIHGSCVSIGCIAITDALIEELFVLALEASNAGTQIPVYLFPFRMTDSNMKKFESEYANTPQVTDFWKNLKLGYDVFQTQHKPIKYTVANDGKYVF